MEQTFLRALKGRADSRQYRVKKKSLAEGAGEAVGNPTRNANADTGQGPVTQRSALTVSVRAGNMPGNNPT
jgi:hypothetical protein